MAKNIIDIPIGGTGISKDDQLELDKYISGLSEFIAYSDMPTTIAIQGEWGSGKTSMMNLLKDRLCRKLVKVEEDDPTEQRPYYGIWINVWKYSLLKTPEMTLLTVLSAMTEQIIEHMNYRHADKLHKIISGIGNKVTKFLTVGTSIGLNFLSNTKLGIGSVVSNPFLPLLSQLNPSKDDGNQQTQSPEEIQNSLNKAIENFIEAESQTSKAKQTHPARGFLFFIDR